MRQLSTVVAIDTTVVPTTDLFATVVGRPSRAGTAQRPHHGHVSPSTARPSIWLGAPAGTENVRRQSVQTYGIGPGCGASAPLSRPGAVSFIALRLLVQLFRHRLELAALDERHLGHWATILEGRHDTHHPVSLALLRGLIGRRPERALRLGHRLALRLGGRQVVAARDRLRPPSLPRRVLDHYLRN